MGRVMCLWASWPAAAPCRFFAFFDKPKPLPMKSELHRSKNTPEKSRSVARWLGMIPVVAIGVIAPSACYTDNYSYQGSPGYRSSYGPSYRSSYGPNYGSGYGSGYGHGHSHGEARHDDYARRQENTREQRASASSRMEQRGEGRKERGSEGWKYESRNEGGEEGYEEKG